MATPLPKARRKAVNLAAMIQEPVERNKEPECECGRPKTKQSKCCDTCVHLDGGTQRQAETIALLRMHPLGLSVGECCGGPQSKNRVAYRTVLRSLLGMLKAGRVRRYWREGDSRVIAPTRADAFAGRENVVGHPGCWVYVLTGRAS